MILIADIGNTRIKWAQVEGGGLLLPGQAVHAGEPARAYEALAAAIDGTSRREIATAYAAEEARPPTRIVAVSVAAAPFCTQFAEQVAARWGVQVEWVQASAAAFGVQCGYRDWRRLGVDRWVALVAARQQVSGGVCIVDAGTTVTFDALDGAGRHLGGLIMPGPGLWARALDTGTAGIGPTELRLDRPAGLALLGRSTAEAVSHAALLALGAAVDRAIAVVAAAWGTRPPLLLTGGDGPVLAKWLESESHYRADLVLEGLAHIVSQS